MLDCVSGLLDLEFLVPGGGLKAENIWNILK